MLLRLYLPSALLEHGRIGVEMACPLYGCKWAAMLLCILGTVEGRHLAQPSEVISPRIVNGMDAERDRFPYVVSLKTFFTQRHLCGGVLIAPNIVLTAAHCIDPNNPQAEIMPRVNVGGLERNDPGAELRFTCRTIFHSEWDGDIKTGIDLAAIILDRPSQKQPIKLDVGATKGEGLKLTALGWGRTHLGTFADILQQQEGFVLIDNNKCNLNVVYNGIIKDHMMCADGGAVDTCEGDSGGPVIYQDKQNNEDVLVGVTSFGPEICGSRRLPSVATRISSVADWIEAIVAENQSGCGHGVSTASDSQAGFDDVCNGKHGIDLNGGVVPLNDGRNTIESSPGACCELCKKTEGCKAWTWMASKTDYNPEGACWMRDAVPVETFCPPCVSGFLNYGGVEHKERNEPNRIVASNGKSCQDVFIGFDLKGYDINDRDIPIASNEKECCELCQKMKRCKAWTRTDDGKCFLKNGVPEISPCPICASGIIRDRVSEDDFTPILQQMAIGEPDG